MDRVKVENGKDFNGNDTEEMFLDTDELYTIGDFIELLQAAKDKWGNQKIAIWNTNENVIGGLGSVCVDKEDGKICIVE